MSHYVIQKAKTKQKVNKSKKKNKHISQEKNSISSNMSVKQTVT